mmetsp:Transcript_24008/g.77076  ORF Transcript_24008/g.77076 Transcript_24008/m.77076 type:complete len:216 (+) Transcript_24008:372-1019(+)
MRSPSPPMYSSWAARCAALAAACSTWLAAFCSRRNGRPMPWPSHACLCNSSVSRMEVWRGWPVSPPTSSKRWRARVPSRAVAKKRRTTASKLSSAWEWFVKAPATKMSASAGPAERTVQSERTAATLERSVSSSSGPLTAGASTYGMMTRAMPELSASPSTCALTCSRKRPREPSLNGITLGRKLTTASTRRLSRKYWMWRGRASSAASGDIDGV